jgi:hypothetical protein
MAFWLAVQKKYNDKQHPKFQHFDKLPSFGYFRYTKLNFDRKDATLLQ